MFISIFFFGDKYPQILNKKRFFPAIQMTSTQILHYFLLQFPLRMTPWEDLTSKKHCRGKIKTGPRIIQENYSFNLRTLNMSVRSSWKQVNIHANGIIQKIIVSGKNHIISKFSSAYNVSKLCFFLFDRQVPHANGFRCQGTIFAAIYCKCKVKQSSTTSPWKHPTFHLYFVYPLGRKKQMHPS